MNKRRLTRGPRPTRRDRGCAMKAVRMWAIKYIDKDAGINSLLEATISGTQQRAWHAVSFRRRLNKKYHCVRVEVREISEWNRN